MANITRRREGYEPSSMARTDPFRAFRDWLRWDPLAEFEPYRGQGAMTWMPEVECKEARDAFVFNVDLPGVKEEDLDVSIEGTRLTISGKREEESREEEDRYFAYERSYGTFSRSFTLPESCDAEHVKAEMKNGVLTVSVPKKPHAQPRRVQIGGGGATTTVKPEIEQASTKKVKTG